MTRQQTASTVILLAIVLTLGVGIGAFLVRRPKPAEVSVPAPAELDLKPLPYNLPMQYAGWVIHYCDEITGWSRPPVWLASRMLDTESDGWNVLAVSPAGAQGLAQIMPENLPEFSRLYNDGRPIDPFDPETAIRVGIRHLASLYGDLHNWRWAVEAYNCGLGRWRAGNLPWETRRHVVKVMGN